MKVYEAIAQAFIARENCARSGNAEWYARHEDNLRALCREYLPSGSGFDNGTGLDFSSSRVNRLVFETSFHHMDENGSYCGWSGHSVILTPDLGLRFDVRVTGRNVRGIKDYVAETFTHAFNDDVRDSLDRAAWRFYRRQCAKGG